MKETMNPVQYAILTDFEDACGVLGIDVAEIRGAGRNPTTTAARRAIAKWLRIPRHGCVQYSFPEIAGVMRPGSSHNGAIEWCTGDPCTIEHAFAVKLREHLGDRTTPYATVKNREPGATVHRAPALPLTTNVFPSNAARLTFAEFSAICDGFKAAPSKYLGSIGPATFGRLLATVEMGVSKK